MALEHRLERAESCEGKLSQAESTVRAKALGYMKEAAEWAEVGKWRLRRGHHDTAYGVDSGADPPPHPRTHKVGEGEVDRGA